jgi:hypothetical protein
MSSQAHSTEENDNEECHGSNENVGLPTWEDNDNIENIDLNDNVVELNHSALASSTILRTNLQELFESKIMKDLDVTLECTRTVESTTKKENSKSSYYMNNIALLINSHPDDLYEKDKFYGRPKSKNLAKIVPSLLFQKMALRFCEMKYTNKEKNPDGYYIESTTRSTGVKTEAKWSTFEEL